MPNPLDPRPIKHGPSLESRETFVITDKDDIPFSVLMTDDQGSRIFMIPTFPNREFAEIFVKQNRKDGSLSDQSSKIQKGNFILEKENDD